MRFITGLFALIGALILMALNLIWIIAGLALIGVVLFYGWPLLLAYVVVVSIIGLITKLRKS
tara:strand:- start:1474 stop:1659 length:186 start_codon:yes stop_codon:yes gene_type:complete